MATVFARQRASPSACNSHGGRRGREPVAGRAALPFREPWPSPSKSNRTRAPPSAAPSTRWRRPSTTRARSATSRAARIGSARSAAATRAGGRRAASARPPRPLRTAGGLRPTTSLRRRMPATPRQTVGSLARGGRASPTLRACPSSPSTPTAPTSARPRSPRARTSPPRQGVRVLLFGPAAEMGNAGPGHRGHRRAAVDRQGGQPRRRRARATPSPRSCAPRRAVADGDADALVSAGATGAALAAGALQHQARPRHPAPRARRADPGPGRAGHARRRRREHRGARRAPRAVRLHGRGARAASCTASSGPRVALLSVGEEATRGTPLTLDVHARLSAAARAELRRQHRGPRADRGQGRRRRHRRLHRQRHAEGHGGRVGQDDRAAAGRPRSRRAAPRPAACSCARRCSAFRDEISPETAGGAYLLGLRKIGVVGHGRFTSRGFAQRDPARRARRHRRRRRAHARRARARRRAAQARRRAVRERLYACRRS